MRDITGKKKRQSARLITAAALVFALVSGGATLSFAKPSKADLQAAESRLNSLNQQMSQLVEQYDQAQAKLQQTEGALQQARSQVQQAQADLAQAENTLSAQARSAYESQGSAIGVLLGATTFADLSDRVQFLDQLSQDGADAATKAQVARESARRATDRLNTILKQRQALVAQLTAKKNQIQSGISKTQSLVDTIKHSLSRQRAQQVINGPAGGGTPPTGGGCGNCPPAQGAGAAVQAAYSALGVPYHYGGADPQHGFDCSGLTMWSWAHAGVSLPHSAAMQYAMTKHVSTSDLQPGDLLFFYTPISHVAMYIGGGREIAASHTGTVVSIYPVDWADFVGAGRP
jgi:cell wall-associated NlpC family hydrolase